jgi:hypothetical protein
MFSGVFEDRGLLCVDIWVEEDLRNQWVSKALRRSETIAIRTWLAAGRTLADANRISRSWTPKLLTPILLYINC